MIAFLRMEQTMIQPTVSLREVTKENLLPILKLSVQEDQNKFVASNAVSIAEAHFEEHAWFRAIYANEDPIGFVMLYRDTQEAAYELWRFMIDQRFQGKGYGQKALEQVIDIVRGLPNATKLSLSCNPAEGGPEPFYRKFGFVETGEWQEDEKIMVLRLKPL